MTAWNNKPTTATATDRNNGLMAATDKLKLNFCVEVLHWGVVSATGTKVEGSSKWQSERYGAGEGQYKVIRSDYSNNTMTIVNGRDGNYASIVTDTPSHFIVRTADDASPNNASFSFITFRFPNI